MRFFRFKNKYKFTKIEDFYKTNPSFCIMQWVHFHVTQEGFATPCCQTRWEKALAFGDINAESVNETRSGKVSFQSFSE